MFVGGAKYEKSKRKAEVRKESKKKEKETPCL